MLISISDEGVGLPAGKADEIYDAFFTTKPQGHGSDDQSFHRPVAWPAREARRSISLCPSNRRADARRLVVKS